MSSLPEVRLTRQRIESCKVKKYRMFLKAEYLFGSRAIEIAGELCSCDRLYTGLTEPYGPRGTDVWLAETDPPDPTWIQVLEILLQIQQGEKSVSDAMAKAKAKIPVAIFKIKIAKQHVEKGEEAPYRLVALPLIDEYEPWAKEMYEYFKAAGDDYVFPFNRQEVWHYIIKIQKVFEGLTYRIKKYVYSKEKPEIISLQFLKDNDPEALPKLLETQADDKGIATIQTERYEYKLLANGSVTRKKTYTIFSHPKPLKNHGLRHIRTNELLADYNFDGIDLSAMIGWSMSSSQQISSSPAQTGTYAEVREMWKRYIRKLCKKNSNNISHQ